MTPLQVLPSTTSHKHEPLLPTLELFARLGMLDLDLNLNHIVEGGTRPETVAQALASNGQRVSMVSGGWCDFFDAEPQIHDTFASVERQVALARRFGVDRLRLFFGRLPLDRWSGRALAACAANIRRVASAHPDLLFVFENHDGAASRPDVCRAVLEAADRPNARLTFDPINFEHAGIDSAAAGASLRHLVAHVHLKGLDHAGRFCEFGEGRIDLVPVVRALVETGYDGAFTVEYEGPFDRTLRLYRSVNRARAVIGRLAQARAAGPASA